MNDVKFLSADLASSPASDPAIILLKMHDWPSTSLGSAKNWPQSLKTTIDIVLGSPFAMVALWGPDLIQIYNDAYAVICGPRHPQAFGQPTRTCWPEVWEFNAPIYEAVFGGEVRSLTDQKLNLHRNNTTEAAWFNLAYSPLRDESGCIAGVLVTVIETTTRVLAEQRIIAESGAQRRQFEIDTANAQIAQRALRESEATLRALNTDLEHQVAERIREVGRTWQLSADMMGVVNAEGFCESSNPAWKTILGWSKSEVASLLFHEIFHPDDLEQTRTVFGEIQRGSSTVHFENRCRCKDGSYRWLSWIAVPEGNKIYCSGRDLTADKAKAAELASRTHERNLLATLIETTDVLIVAVGIDYRILAANQASISAFERIYGIRPKVNDDMLALLAHLPEHQAHMRDLWAPALAGQEFTVVDPFADSALMHPSYEIKFKTLWNSQGERIGAYQFVLDVTERLREQTKLVSAQDALRQSQKMEAVGQLTGGIAHDFNNMLQGISGALEMLQVRNNQGRFGESGRYIDTALAGVERAGALTHRLLAFARKQPLDPKQVDANKLIGGIEELVRRIAGPGIEVVFYLSNDLWTTLCDANQLENALLNLAINARDVMPDGGKLTIETGNVRLDDDYARSQGDGLMPGQYVSIGVTDTGTGMAAETIKRAFEPFFTTKPAGEGTGLGLSMLYGFAKQSKGHAQITSQPGQGTTVSLYLPRDHVDERLADVGSGHPQKTIQTGLGETILLVEDEEAIRALVAEMLRDEGYRVLEAGDGPSGLAVLQSTSRVDLLITDVGLPGMNGRQMAVAARASLPDLKVLFITGYTHNAKIGQGEVLETGTSIMSKPFALSALAAKIRVMIDA